MLSTINWQDLTASAPILPTTPAGPVTLQQVNLLFGTAYAALGTWRVRSLKQMGAGNSPSLRFPTCEMGTAEDSILSHVLGGLVASGKGMVPGGTGTVVRC